MIALDFGFGALEGELWRLFFLMLRVGAAMMAAPFFGAASIPVLVRICATGALAVFVAAWLPVNVPPALFSLTGLLAAAGEILVGLALGFALQVAFAAPVVAAEVFAGGMGMSMALTSDPNGGQQMTAFGQYLSIVLILIFLSLGAHLHWMALVVESYRVFPPGETWLGPERFEAIAGFGGTLFETALRITLPVSLVLLLVQLVTGILSRSAPALNLFALGLPAGVLAGLAALIVAAPIIYDQLEGVVATGLEQATGVMAR